MKIMKNKANFRHNSRNKTIETAGRVYTDSPIRGNFHKLREANYGQGFRPSTFGEILSLADQSYINQGNAGADNVVQAARKFWLSGNTSAYGGEEIIIVQNFPNIEGGRIVMNPKELEDLLSRGKDLVKGVRLSRDGRVGSVSREMVREGWHDEEEIRNSLYPIVLALNKEGSNNMAGISNTTKKKAYFRFPAVGEIRVPGLVEVDGRLGLGGDDWFGFDDYSYSFGVRE